MRIAYIVFLLPIVLGGCVSYSETPVRTGAVVVPATSTITTVTPGMALAPGTTTVVPAGTIIVCSNGMRPPC